MMRPRISARRQSAAVFNNVVLVMLALLVSSATAQYTTCRSQLQKADADSDETLSGPEFANYMKVLSGDLVTKNAQFFDDNYGPSFSLAGLAEDASVEATQELQDFCDAIYQRMASTLEVETTQGDCIGALQVADKNPSNGRLNNDPEFLAFIPALVEDAYADTETFDDLPVRVQAAFNDYAVDGEVSSTKGIEFLVEFCQRTALNIKIDQNTVVETAAPTQTPVAVPDESTEAHVAAPEENDETAPSFTPLTDAEYATCRTALLLADRSRDDKLDSSEFSRFADRLSKEELDETALQQLFTQLVSNGDDENVVDVTGFRVNPTDEQKEAVESICRATMDFVSETSADDTPVSTESPVASPTKSPTVTEEEEEPVGDVPTKAPTTDPVDDPTDPTVPPQNAVETCLQRLINVNENGDDLIDVVEFVAFVNGAVGGSYQDYINLPESLRLVYREAAGSNDGFDVSGILPDSGTTNEELKSLCTTLNSSLESLQTVAPAQAPGVAILSPRCERILSTADADEDGFISEAEYANIVQSISATKNDKKTSFENLPFMVRENYLWLKGTDDNLPLASLSTRKGQAQGLFLCDKMIRVVQHSAEQTDAPTSFFDQCKYSSSRADLDGDNALSKDEFFSFLNEMSAFSLTGMDFEQANNVIEPNFHQMQGENETVNVGAAKADTKATAEEIVAFETFCVRVNFAVSTARASNAFFQSCQVSLVVANHDGDDILSREEYVDFLYDVAGVYREDEVGFSELDDVLKINYDLLRSRKDNVEIPEVSNPFQVEKTESENVRWICDKVEAVIDSVQPTIRDVVSVYNSFIVANDVSIAAGDLEVGNERTTLEKSYRTFVNEEAVNFIEMRRSLRGSRNLAATGIVPDSIRLYRIETQSCPDTVGTNFECQVAYGSFDVEYVNERDPQQLSGSLSRKTQTEIEAGELQKILTQLDPSFPIDVVGPARSLRPADVTGGGEQVAQQPGSSSLGAAIGGSIAGAIIGAALLYCYMKRRGGKGHDSLKPTEEGPSMSMFDHQEPERAPESRMPSPSRTLHSTVSPGTQPFSIQEAHTETDDNYEKKSSTFGTFMEVDQQEPDSPPKEVNEQEPESDSPTDNGFGTFGFQQRQNSKLDDSVHSEAIFRKSGDVWQKGDETSTDYVDESNDDFFMSAEELLAHEKEKDESPYMGDDYAEEVDEDRSTDRQANSNYPRRSSGPKKGPHNHRGHPSRHRTRGGRGGPRHRGSSRPRRAPGKDTRGDHDRRKSNDSCSSHNRRRSNDSRSSHQRQRDNENRSKHSRAKENLKEAENKQEARGQNSFKAPEDFEESFVEVTVREDETDTPKLTDQPSKDASFPSGDGAFDSSEEPADPTSEAETIEEEIIEEEILEENDHLSTGTPDKSEASASIHVRDEMTEISALSPGGFSSASKVSIGETIEENEKEDDLSSDVASQIESSEDEMTVEDELTVESLGTEGEETIEDEETVESATETSEAADEESEEEESEEESETDADETEAEDETAKAKDSFQASSASVNSAPEVNELREKIQSLMMLVMPDEVENLDAMMEQFSGREDELIGTLENMANGEIELSDEDDDEESEEEESEEASEESAEWEDPFESAGEEDLSASEEGEAEAASSDASSESASAATESEASSEEESEEESEEDEKEEVSSEEEESSEEESESETEASD